MNKLMRILAEFSGDMRMELSTSKTFILSNVLNEVSWTYELETIEETLVAKYLGVDIQIRGRRVLCNYKETMISRALSYAYSILGLSWQGIDRARVARKLWETCAVTVILYCSEASVFRQSTLDELDCIQNMVGRLILQNVGMDRYWLSAYAI